jgi:hypothetical protein
MLNTKKAPGMDLITVKKFKELPEKTVKALMHIFNAILRLHNLWPLEWYSAPQS